MKNQNNLRLMLSQHTSKAFMKKHPSKSLMLLMNKLL